MRAREPGREWAVDIEVARVAAEQDGPIHRRQLLAAGMSTSTIGRRLRSGRLHLKYHNVYLVGHVALSDRGEAIAGLLTCGKGSRLTFLTAANRRGFVTATDGRVHVTAERRPHRRADPLVVHVTRTLDPRDVTRKDGLPITTPARTLLDLGGVLGPGDLADALAEAEVLRLVTEPQLRHQIERNKHHPGAKPLRAILGDDDRRRSKRALARGYLDLIRQTDLPRPSIEHPIGLFRIDAYYEDARLAVELQSWTYHGTRSRFRRDAERTQYLDARGITVFPVTWEDVFETPMALIARNSAAWTQGVARNERSP